MSKFAQRLRELLDKATVAPWIYDERVGAVAVYGGPERNCLDTGESFIAYHHGKQGTYGWYIEEVDTADLQLITYLRNHAEALLALVEHTKRLYSGHDDSCTCPGCEALRRLEDI